MLHTLSASIVHQYEIYVWSLPKGLEQSLFFDAPIYCCSVQPTEINLNHLRIVRACLFLHQRTNPKSFFRRCVRLRFCREASTTSVVLPASAECHQPPLSPESVFPPQWLSCIRPCVCSRTEPHSTHLGWHFPYAIPYLFLPVIRASEGASRVLIT